jgi:hypothetical protein
MSDERRGGSGGFGGAFVLLIVVGAIVKFWVWIAVAFGAAVVFGLLLWLAFYAARRVDAREHARIAIVARADQAARVDARRRRPRRLPASSDVTKSSIWRENSSRGRQQVDRVQATAKGTKSRIIRMPQSERGLVLSPNAPWRDRALRSGADPPAGRDFRTSRLCYQTARRCRTAYWRCRQWRCRARATLRPGRW